jgi:putative endonuclease
VSRANVSLGGWGEQRAAAHFVRLGFHVLARNWRPHGYGVRGDLDLIVARDDLVVVCEVKARRAGSPGGAVAAVTPAKQEQIRLLTELWLAEQDTPDTHLRFDVIAVDGVRITHYEAAF